MDGHHAGTVAGRNGLLEHLADLVRVGAGSADPRDPHDVVRHLVDTVAVVDAVDRQMKRYATDPVAAGHRRWQTGRGVSDDDNRHGVWLSGHGQRLGDHRRDQGREVAVALKPQWMPSGFIC